MTKSDRILKETEVNKQTKKNLVLQQCHMEEESPKLLK